MGVGDIVGLGVCWLFVAVLLVWGVLTEGRRGGSDAAEEPRRPIPPAARAPVARPPVTGWILVETLPGSGPDVRREGELVVRAALAARGVDVAELAPADQRVEVTTVPGGGEATRFLLRPEVFTPTGPR